MTKPRYGNKTRQKVAKLLRMPADNDRFSKAWECLAHDGIIEDWEKGSTTDEDIRADAKVALRHVDIIEGRSPSTGRKQERRMLRDIPVEPTEHERQTSQAFRKYLAAHAAQRPIVRKLRREYLPDGLYTDDHDISLLLEEQKVARAGMGVQRYLDSHQGKPNIWATPIVFSTKTPPDDDSESVSDEDQAVIRAEEEIEEERKMMEEWWGEGKQKEDEDAWEPEEDLTEEAMAYEEQLKKSFEGYFGWYLEELGEWLADKYPWENVGDAVVFLISGRPPRLAEPLSATIQEESATYSITFLPWVSEQTILRAYHLLRSRHRQVPGDKTIRVLRFVAEQTDEEGRLPSWSTLLSRWNAANPDDRFANRSALYKAYGRAVEALVPPYLPLAENTATWYQRFDHLTDR